jgi:hypothetical protein
LGLLFEKIRDYNETEFNQYDSYDTSLDIDSLIEPLKELAHEKSSFVAKKDAKKQRSTFKEVLNSITV